LAIHPSVGCPGPWWTEEFIGGHLYRGKLIRCQNDHDDYACLRGEVAMLDVDGTNSSTQVSVARHV
jgi:hypothetical protein